MTSRLEYSGLVPLTYTVSLPSEDQRTWATKVGADIITRNIFSLALFNLESKEVLSVPGLDPANRTTFAEYFFTVPPRQYEVGEPFSTVIIPTQDGGKYVESHGSIIKDIRVQGTTGLRPNKKIRNDFSSIPLFGSALTSIANELEAIVEPNQGLLPEEATGFDDIIFLRNLFRHYSDVKIIDQGAKHTVMLFRNAQESEYWIVEPMAFRLVRSHQSPMTYEYELQLRTLTKFASHVSLIQDPLLDYLDPNAWFHRRNQIFGSVKRILGTIATQATRLEALGVQVVQTLEFGNILLEGLAEIASNNKSLLAHDKVTYATKALISNSAESISKLGRSSYELVGVFKRAYARLASLAASTQADPVLGEVRAAREIDRLQSNYTRAYTKPGTISSPRQAPSGRFRTFIGNENNVRHVAQGTVHNGETIRNVAGRLLGDPNRWQVIVLLNGLRPPYITATGTQNTLKPGDPVLYPVSARQTVPQILAQKSKSSDTSNQGTAVIGPAQHAYGRDLRLRTVTDPSGAELTDLAVSQGGDVATLVGIPNVEQGIRIKFATSVGELPVHPQFGTIVKVGEKLTPIALSQHRIAVEATLLSDSRVRSIDKLTLSAAGDAILVYAEVKLKATADVLLTSFGVRGF